MSGLKNDDALLNMNSLDAGHKLRIMTRYGGKMEQISEQADEDEDKTPSFW